MFVMKKLSLLFIALALFILTSCQDEKNPAEPSSVNLQFKGYFADDLLEMYAQAYPYEGNTDVKFQLFQFYVSDVTLLPADPSAPEVPVLDIGLVSFRDVQSAESAERGVTLQTGEAPAGRYRGIRFGIGVSPALNATQPSDYPPGHPLTDHYWSWATGYVFFKIEGNADTNRDGTFEDKLTFHIGLNDFYREKTFTQPLEVTSGTPATINFTVDLHRVLASSGSDFVDFRQVTQDHTNNRDLARFLADNLQSAIQLKNN